MVRQFVKRAAVAAGVMLIATSVRAKSQLSEAARNRRELVPKLEKGPLLVRGGQRYQFLGGVRAVRRAQHEETTEALARAGATPVDLVEAIGPFLVFLRASAPASATRQAGDHGELFPVAVNLRTGRLGVALGIIAVRLRDPITASRVAADARLELAFSAAHLGTAFLRVPAGVDLQGAAAMLARDDRVLSAEIELREDFDEPL